MKTKIKIALVVTATAAFVSTLVAGNFLPVHNTLATGGSSTVCGHPVKTKYVRFSFDTNGASLLTQTPGPTVTGYYGYVVDLNTGLGVPNNEFYLQWLVNGLPQNNGCATNVIGSTTDVGFTVTAAELPHRFTAFFKTSSTHPINGHVYELQGDWTE